MKILIVDDSTVMRKIIQRTLRQAGFEGHDISEAGDGAEALAKVESEAPDLILADWNMPEMSGIALLETLADKGSCPSFCFITSEVSDDMKKRALDAGATAFVTKPFTPESFRDQLLELIA